MGAAKTPSKVKLVIGLLGADREILDSARTILKKIHGTEMETMEPIPFTWTRYYARELGGNPWRTLVAYEDLIARETLVDIKLATNRLEKDFLGPGGRLVNLDPGYLTLGQLFLASTKDQRQRVYIRDGIYVEPTLYFQDGAFQPFPWTYPDFRSPEYARFFLGARESLAARMRNENPTGN